MASAATSAAADNCKARCMCVCPCEDLSRKEQIRVQAGSHILRNHRARVHNLVMFDWNDLKYFLAVARNGSTLAAARSLRLSQSTVHRRLEELERKLGHPLVKRHPTGYRLTELGVEMRDYAERVESAISDFERRVSAWGKELSGVVRVTCPEALGPRLLRSGLIAKFNARYPALGVEIVMNDKVVDLAKGHVDIAIRTVPSHDNASSAARSPIAAVAFCKPSLRQKPRRHRSPQDIDRHAVVIFGGEMRDHHSVGVDLFGRAERENCGAR